MKKHRVALIIETSGSYGRDLLAGVIRFMRTNNDWSVYFEQRDIRRVPPRWLDSWHGDGILSRVTTPQLAKAVERTGVPLVELTDRGEQGEMPQVRSDDVAIGRMAAAHLLERGFTCFGFCGYSGEAWSSRRAEGFTQAINESGCACDVFNSEWFPSGKHAWDNERRRIADWLRKLIPPFAIMACNDDRAHDVLSACSEANLLVPEHVAVIGVDNDELLCRLCSPMLSSVVVNAKMVGYRGAEMLSQLMNGEQVAATTELVLPVGVEVRQSTEIVAIADQRMAQSLRVVRDQACLGLTVESLAKQVKASRSTLERQFRKSLGRSPQAEIRRVQVDRVCELLRATGLTLEEIAPLCGFDHTEYMHVVFKRFTNTSPGAYREQARQW